MEIKFLGQGYENVSPDSVGNNLIALFRKGDHSRLTILTAFLSLAGVKGLEKLISENGSTFNQIILITGVDQKGTSKEALDGLLSLGIEAYVFYQPGASIFHPKVYFFEGSNHSSLIVGSSNLTAQGLFVNVEASLLINIDHNNGDDGQVIDEFKQYYDGLYNLSDPNLQPLSEGLIQTLVSFNIVPTEAERRNLYTKTTNAVVAPSTSNISGTFPSRQLAKISSDFRIVSNVSSQTTTANSQVVVAPTATSSAQTNVAIGSDQAIPSSPVSQRGQLVWVRRTLPSSSVQQSADGTNPTGGLRLVQDQFTVGGVRIDQTSYFRNTLFGSFNWHQVRQTPFVEAATVQFEIIISGNNVGVFNLDVRHKPSGVAGQGNYTTSISWGSAAGAVSSQDLTGFRLELYEPASPGLPFQIVIN
jgi:HKD family nuclease